MVNHIIVNSFPLHTQVASSGYSISEDDRHEVSLNSFLLHLKLCFLSNLSKFLPHCCILETGNLYDST